MVTPLLCLFYCSKLLYFEQSYYIQQVLQLYYQYSFFYLFRQFTLQPRFRAESRLTPSVSLRVSFFVFSNLFRNVIEKVWKKNCFINRMKSFYRTLPSQSSSTIQIRRNKQLSINSNRRCLGVGYLRITATILFQSSPPLLLGMIHLS